MLEKNLTSRGPSSKIKAGQIPRPCQITKKKKKKAVVQESDGDVNRS